MTRPIPLAARLILLRPERVRANLDRVRASGLVPPADVPNEWQVAMGVLRMVHRLLFRSETIGTSKTSPVRPGCRAKIFQYRPLRFPFLLREGSVAPLDLSGFTSTPERLIRHLLGTHHDGVQFVYDLQLLSCWPGRLEALRDRAREVVERDTRRSRWLRDLVVYEGYHEALLRVVEEALAAGLALPPDAASDPDISLVAWLRWCAGQPATPAEAWRAWRRGELSLYEVPTEEAA